MIIIKYGEDGSSTVEQPLPSNGDFLEGYRQGFPLVGEQLPPVPDNPSSDYLRGLEWGRRDYVPGIAYEE